MNRTHAIIRTHHSVRHVAIAAVAAITFAACGSDSDSDAPVTETPTSETADQASATPAADSAPAVATGDTSIGAVLTDVDGNTLYGFTSDTDGSSTCSQGCAEAWPPLIVDADFVLADGLGADVFSTTARDDGTLQLVAGDMPLYRFAGDAAVGDVNGHGSGDVWFAIDATGTLLPVGAAEGAAGDSDDAEPAESGADDADVYDDGY